MMMGMGIGLSQASVSSGDDPIIGLVAANGGAIYAASQSVYQDRSATPSTVAGNGDPVGTALDLSGNGHEIIAQLDARRPTLTQSGALWYLDFDGTDDELQQQAILELGTGSFICAGLAKKVATDDVTRIIGSGSFGQMRWNGSGTLDCVVGSAVVNEGRINHAIGNSTVPQVLSWGRSSAANNAYLREDGTEVRTRNHTITSHNQTWSVGSAGNGSYSSMQLYALVFLNKYPTADEITTVETWVAAQAGVTLA